MWVNQFCFSTDSPFWESQSSSAKMDIGQGHSHAENQSSSIKKPIEIGFHLVWCRAKTYVKYILAVKIHTET
jgi:hypothetical protein